MRQRRRLSWTQSGQKEAREYTASTIQHPSFETVSFRKGGKGGRREIEREKTGIEGVKRRLSSRGMPWVNSGQWCLDGNHYGVCLLLSPV